MVAVFFVERFMFLNKLAKTVYYCYMSLYNTSNNCSNTSKYYNLDSKFLQNDISADLLKFFGTNPPIVACVGSDKVMGDFVGTLVAEILKSRGISTYVFGGVHRPLDKFGVDVLLKKFGQDKLLFVDSGLLAGQNQILVNTKTRLNNGCVINSPCIVASTIKTHNGKIMLSAMPFCKILKYSTIIANAICDYFSYIDLILNKSN